MAGQSNTMTAASARAVDSHISRAGAPRPMVSWASSARSAAIVQRMNAASQQSTASIGTTSQSPAAQRAKTADKTRTATIVTGARRHKAI